MQNGDAAVFTTDDAGSSWAAAAIPLGMGSLYAVTCAPGNDDTCLAVGDAVMGVIIETNDGGSTWQEQTTPALQTLSGVTCVSATSCIVVGTDLANTAEVVLTTTDFGGTWTSVKSVPADFSPLLGVSCSASTCFAVGTAGVLISSNSGSSWKKSSAPYTDLAGVDCSGSTCQVVGSADDYQTGLVAETTNDGATWASETIPSGILRLSAISCTTDSLCTTVGESTDGNSVVALGTTSAGSMWSAETLPPTIDTFSGISCPTSMECFAVGSTYAPNDPTGTYGVILTTSDGGTQWNPLVSAGAGVFLDSISCGSASDCVAVGTANSYSVGVILVTTDGGATWTRSTSPSEATELFGVSCPTVDSCIAVGYGNSGPPRRRASSSGLTMVAQTGPSSTLHPQ